MTITLKTRELETSLQEASGDKERFDALLALAYALRNNESQRAFALCAEAATLLGQPPSEGQSAEIEYVRGVCECCRADYDAALAQLFRALRHAQDLGLQSLETRVSRWIGIAYIRTAMYATALEHLSKARSLNETLGDVFGEAQCWNNIGDVYYGLGDYKAALGYHRIALRSLEEFGDIEQRAIALHSIALACQKMGDYKRSLLYHQQSLSIRRDIGDATGAGTSLSGIAHIYALQGQADKALEILFQVMDMAERHHNDFGLTWVRCGVGELYLSRNKPDKALPYLLKALEYIEANEIANISTRTHQLLADCYKALGDAAKALEHFERFHAISSQAAEQDKKQAIRYLQRGFEAEKARQDAEIYRLKNVELANANKQNEQLLLNVLPSAIAERLKKGETTIADKFSSVTVLFADIAGFTELSASIGPEDLVALLDNIFSDFDAVASRHGLEKIKTIGDCYMLVGGLPEPCPNHAERVAKAALQLRSVVDSLSAALGLPLAIRIGIHTGEVVAGVIGKKKFAYDLWGDTVNTASRMESHGEPGEIHCSQAVYVEIKDAFELERRGEIEIKGKGTMRTYFLRQSREKQDIEAALRNS